MYSAQLSVPLFSRALKYTHKGITWYSFHKESKKECNWAKKNEKKECKNESKKARNIKGSCNICVSQRLGQNCNFDNSRHYAQPHPSSVSFHFLTRTRMYALRKKHFIHDCFDLSLFRLAIGLRNAPPHSQPIRSKNKTICYLFACYQICIACSAPATYTCFALWLACPECWDRPKNYCIHCRLFRMKVSPIKQKPYYTLLL